MKSTRFVELTFGKVHIIAVGLEQWLGIHYVCQRGVEGWDLEIWNAGIKLHVSNMCGLLTKNRTICGSNGSITSILRAVMCGSMKLLSAVAGVGGS